MGKTYKQKERERANQARTSSPIQRNAGINRHVWTVQRPPEKYKPVRVEKPLSSHQQTARGKTSSPHVPTRSAPGNVQTDLNLARTELIDPMRPRQEVAPLEIDPDDLRILETAPIIIISPLYGSSSWILETDITAAHIALACNRKLQAFREAKGSVMKWDNRIKSENITHENWGRHSDHKFTAAGEHDVGLNVELNSSQMLARDFRKPGVKVIIAPDIMDAEEALRKSEWASPVAPKEGAEFWNNLAIRAALRVG